LTGQLHKQAVELTLIVLVTGLEFQVEIGSEDVQESRKAGDGAVPMAVQEEPRERAAEACRRRDQSSSVTPQGVPVDPGFVVETIAVALRAQRPQVVQALVVLGQQNQVVV